jgi:hypothetical protein
LDWFKKLGVLPDPIAIKSSIVLKKPNLFKWLCFNEIMPDEKDVESLINSNWIDMLEFLDSINFLFTQSDVNYAAKHAKLNILIWFSEMDLYPNHEVFDDLNTNKHLPIIKWMLQLENPIVLTSKMADNACGEHSIEMIKFLAEHKVYPTPKGLHEFIHEFDEEILNFLWEVGVKMDIDDCELAIIDECLETSEWLFEHKIFPTQQFVDEVAEGDNISLLEFLAEHDILPSKDYYINHNMAISGGMFTFLSEHDLIPKEHPHTKNKKLTNAKKLTKLKKPLPLPILPNI